MQSTPETNDLQGKSDEFIRAYDIFNAAMDRDFTSGAVEFSRKSKRDYAEAFALFTHCANQGDGAAMYYISIYYQIGLPPFTSDLDLFFSWTLRSYESGFIFSGNNLYPMYATPRSKFYNPERAVQVMDAIKLAGCKYVTE